MNCKFYEVDLAAKREADECEAAYLASMSPERREAEEAYMAADAADPNDPLTKCAFCKHLNEGKGFPGEYVYFCNAPDNAHIIHVDFNESEII